MDRRFLLQSLAAAGMVSQVAPRAGAQADGAARKTRLYRIDYFYYRQGDQGARINQLLSSQMPLLTRHVRTLGVFTAVMTPHLQTTMILSGFSSFEEMTTAGRAVESDPGYQQAHEEFERGAGPALRVIEGASSCLYTHRRLQRRTLKTIFGSIDIDRVGYSRDGVSSIHPLDEAMQLPARSFSYELQKRLVKAAVQGPFRGPPNEYWKLPV